MTRRLSNACKLAAIAATLALAGCVDQEHSTRLAPRSAPARWHFGGFSEVRAFRTNWDDPDGYLPLVSMDNELNPARIPEDGVRLTDEQVARLKDAVCGKHAENMSSACFDPHHAFLFLSDEGEIVGSIDVCFQCGNYQGSPSGFSKYLDWESLAALLKELEIPISNPEWR